MTSETLTGNDLALCESSVQHALAWWAGQPASGFKRKQVKLLTALLVKLAGIHYRAYPYAESEAMPLDIGNEALMQLDESVVAQTRDAALGEHP